LLLPLLQNQGGATAAQASGAVVSAPAETTRIITLKEAVTLEELANDEEYNDILEDMREECSKVRSCLSGEH
jgi:splicing factor U2AF subunit